MADNRTLYMRSTKIAAGLVVLMTVLALEPFAGINNAFAVTYFTNPTSSYRDMYISDGSYNDAPLIAEQGQSPVRQKTHAPEPGTLVTILAGAVSFAVRFMRRSFERFKRIFDLAFSMIGLIISLPIMGMAAAAIKLTSPGPAFYRQKRVGKDGRLFYIYKLRSMRTDAEKNTGAVWAKAHDARITPIGRILRKTHIDEVPQFFNVIKGDMSIIGPRPERPELVKDFKKLIAGYEERLAVKPGITGLAQVLHKYDETIEDVRKKIQYDAQYIHSRSLRVDMEILARTCVSVTTGRGAH